MFSSTLSRPVVLVAAVTISILLLSSLALQAQPGGLNQVQANILAWQTGDARSGLEKIFDGNDPAHLIAMGEILQQERKYDEAASRFQQAAERAKADPAPWAHLGEVRLRQQKTGESNEAFRKAADLARRQIEADDKKADAHYWLGVAQQRLKNYDAAIQSLQRARELRPGHALTLYQMGATRSFQEQWEPAVDLLTQAIDKNSGIAFSYYLRGLSASKLGRKEMLINDLDRFLTLAPNAPEAALARRILQSASR